MSGAQAQVENLHASALLLGPGAVLIRGPARSGKSSALLAALNRGRSAGLPAMLLADDRVLARRDGGDVVLSPPESITGLVEVSGAGLIRMPFAAGARLALVADLSPAEAIPRLPEETHVIVTGVAVRRIFLPERQASFAADTLLALAFVAYRFDI